MCIIIYQYSKFHLYMSWMSVKNEEVKNVLYPLDCCFFKYNSPLSNIYSYYMIKRKKFHTDIVIIVYPALTGSPIGEGS